MGLAQYPARSQWSLVMLLILCISGFLANGTVIALAHQAQVQAITQNNGDERELVQNTERVLALQKRLDDMQSQKLADRVTRLETIAETNHALLITVTASIAVLMLETALRLIATISPLVNKRKAD